jgi:hypothetical protein
MEVKVFLETEHVDNSRGVIKYDKELVLKEVRVKLKDTVYKPNIETEGEKTYKGGKGLSFGFMKEDAIEGTNHILTLIYDISNCEEGKSYSISWDTDNLAGSGNCTYAVYNHENRDIQAEGLVFTIADDDGSDEDEEAKKKAEEEATRKAEEEARKKAEEEAKKKAEEEEARKKAEEEANKQKAELSVTISYDVTTPTTGKVTAVITANKNLKELSGWTLSADGNVLTKQYSANKTETVTVEDENGNTKSVQVKIENIVDTSANNTAKNNTSKNNTSNNTSNNTAKNNSSNQANKNYPQTGSSTTIIIGATIAIIVLMGVVAFIKSKKTKF